MNPRASALSFGARKHHHFKCEGTYLENVDPYKYLGVWISKNGKFNKAKNHINLQAKKVCLYTLKRTLIKLVILLSNHFYGCETWGFKNDIVIELQFIF